MGPQRSVVKFVSARGCLHNVERQLSYAVIQLLQQLHPYTDLGIHFHFLCDSHGFLHESYEGWLFVALVREVAQSKFAKPFSEPANCILVSALHVHHHCEVQLPRADIGA